MGLKLGNIKAKVVLRDKRAFIYRNLGPNNEDPAVSWSAIKCIKASAAKTKGNTKCNAKNLFNVALLTLKPPQMTDLLRITFNLYLHSQECI